MPSPVSRRFTPPPFSDVYDPRVLRNPEDLSEPWVGTRTTLRVTGTDRSNPVETFPDGLGTHVDNPQVRKKGSRHSSRREPPVVLGPPHVNVDRLPWVDMCPGDLDLEECLSRLPHTLPESNVGKRLGRFVFSFDPMTPPFGPLTHHFSKSEPGRRSLVYGSCF